VVRIPDGLARDQAHRSPDLTPVESQPSAAEAHTRLSLTVRGAVQGVGFRPFVYRLALELELGGWVRNTAQGVLVEVEGPAAAVEGFAARLEGEHPPRASIQSLERRHLDAAGYDRFDILPSLQGEKSALVLPDISSCAECLVELFDPADRRHRYPFTNCTNCGPRFSIIEALPYDRSNTTMRGFVMCSQCRAEYEDPLDRRFHAQPNACPECGPGLELSHGSGRIAAVGDEALEGAVTAVREGAVVAVKGLGGFHLMVRADDEPAVRRLRRRKGRDEKPLALMAPGLDWAVRLCDAGDVERRILESPESPIVLLRRRGEASEGFRVAPSVAPGNPYLGVMLPYTPLHHLLLADLGVPVVATSGNLSDEPICTDNQEALERLGDVADIFLLHDRPIARHVDDTVARVMVGREMILRRARGFAPLPLDAGRPLPRVLALGGHLKNAVAFSLGRQVFVSQHIGDLDTAEAHTAFRKAVSDLPLLYETTPEIIACDAHPDYASSQWARRLTPTPFVVQHHYAHILSCMAENEVPPPALGVSWDGTGWGPDGTVWGGEFLRISESGFERVGFLRPFPLPGGDRAVREPRRSALGLLYEMMGPALWERSDLALLDDFSADELSTLRRMLDRGVNCPRTSSAGRLFDAVAALVGRRGRVSFEGQAAMEIEFLAETLQDDGEPRGYPLSGFENAAPPLIVDWRPMIEKVLDDLGAGTPRERIVAQFHWTLCAFMVAVARRVGENRVVLSGGCFQNRLLTEGAVRSLRAEGYRVYWHQRVPPNDGGIALGQVMATISQSGGEFHVSSRSR
jgi:hydrogenase maturation protein HypF